MAMWAEAMLAMAMGMKKGETLSNPFWLPFMHSFCKVMRPPMPVEKMTPQR